MSKPSLSQVKSFAVVGVNRWVDVTSWVIVISVEEQVLMVNSAAGLTLLHLVLQKVGTQKFYFSCFWGICCIFGR